MSRPGMPGVLGKIIRRGGKPPAPVRTPHPAAALADRADEGMNHLKLVNEARRLLPALPKPATRAAIVAALREAANG